MKKTIIIILAVLLTGCMTPRKISRFKSIYCIDSVSVQIKKNIVKVPVYYSDSSMFELFMACDSLGNIYWNKWKETDGKYTDLQAYLENNKLTVTNYVKIHDTIKITEHDTIKFEQVIKEVEKPFKKIDSFTLVCGYILWGLVLIAILYFVVKYLIKRFKLKL